MSWDRLFIGFLAAHVVGDYLLQTDWQALHKQGGLGYFPIARRALTRHVAVYVLAFVPALVWLAHATPAAAAPGAVGAVGIALLVAVRRVIVDDGRVFEGYLRRVKGCDGGLDTGVARRVDQSFHIVARFGAALVTVA